MAVEQWRFDDMTDDRHLASTSIGAPGAPYMEDPAITAVRDAFTRGACSKMSGSDYHANRALIDAMAAGVVDAIREFARRDVAAKGGIKTNWWWR
jgi:hypothetical protein